MLNLTLAPDNLIFSRVATVKSLLPGVLQAYAAGTVIYGSIAHVLTLAL